MAAGKAHLFCVILITVFTNIKADYKAAVVEYQPIRGISANATVEENLKNFVWYIEKAQENGAQIIVFPEYGLTGIVENVTDYAIEIPNVGNGTQFGNYWLEKLSNAAKSNALYVVVNLLEKSVNKANKTVYYNTNIVFDVNGKIVSKYRKFNLVAEPKLTRGVPKENQLTFTTNFGITFGVLTSFDLLYDSPLRALLSKNVTDIVYSTSSNSYLPFLHSLTTQEGFATANEVNLLAASLDIPEVGIGGSGMWGSDGTAFSYYISGTGTTKILIGSIKNTPNYKVLGERPLLGGFDTLDDTVSSMKNYNASRYFQHDKYTFKSINISQVNINDEVCHKGFCCQFSINVSYVPLNNSLEKYKIMAYNGPLDILPVKKNYKVCSLIGCESSDINTCGKNAIHLTTKFKRISVTTNIPNNSTETYRPLSLTTNLIPVFNSSFHRVIADKTRILKYSNEFEQSNVLVFGILDINNSSSTTIVCNAVLLTFILLVNRLFL